jgi:tetratricopeptide (TPR) repeat protein
MPFPIAMMLAILAFLGHLAAAVPLARAADARTFDEWIILCVPFVSLGIAPAIVYFQILIASLTQSTGNLLFSSRTARPLTTDFSRAHTLERQGDISSALEQYWSYFDANPKSPQPLFEAASMLTRENRHREAANTLRETIRLFKDDDTIWGQASFRLAEILRNHLKDKDGATIVLREIARRCPQSNEGRRARLWLNDMTDGQSTSF